MTSSTSDSSVTLSSSNNANSSTISRPYRPLSEALLHETWDHCLSNLLVKSTLGFSFGVVFSALLFRRRAWPVWLGLGFGAGRAWEECDNEFKQAAIKNKKPYLSTPNFLKNSTEST